MNGVCFRWRLPLRFAPVAALALGLACLTGCLPCGECGRSPTNGSNPPSTREFAIEGMTCEGCVQTITAALKAIPGVQSAEVSLQEKKATVVADESAAPNSKIEEAVQRVGYKATALAAPPAE